VVISCRCGALHVGDQILAVDGTRVDGAAMTAMEVMQLLRNTNNAHISLEILPLSQLNCGWRLSESVVRSRGRATKTVLEPIHRLGSLCSNGELQNSTNQSVCICTV